MARETTHCIGGKHAAGTSGRFAEAFDPNTGAVQAKRQLAIRAVPAFIATCAVPEQHLRMD